MIDLEREASLRVEAGACAELACLAGVVWVTHEGDIRDLFLARGESMALPSRGVTLVTALEAATVRVLERAPEQWAAKRWAGLMSLVRSVPPWRWLAARTIALVKPRAAQVG